MNFSDIIDLLTGAALFLYGMTLMGDGLKQVSGSRLEPVLYRLSGSPTRGMALGMGVTAVIQSSSATSVMVVGFVNAGMMRLRQAIPVILGAMLGTSVTGWVVCLGYMDGAGAVGTILSGGLTCLIAVTGIVLRMFAKRQTLRRVGDILLGFSVLMFGIGAIGDAGGRLGEASWFNSLLGTVTSPVPGILAGIALSALLQSASAAVGMVQALSVSGAVTLASSLPMLMGIAIGASLPVLLSALGAGTEGRRAAVSYLTASVLGVLATAALFYLANAIFRFPFLDAVMNPVSLALVNTVLRLAMMCLLVPFTDVLEALAVLLVPEKRETPAPQVLALEDRFLAYPALAVEQSREEMDNMARDAERSVISAVGLFTNFSEEGFAEVHRLEDRTDRREDALGTYLVKLTGRDLNERQSRDTAFFLQILPDFERITDHAMNLAISARQMHEKQRSFSGEASAELRTIEAALGQALRITSAAFIDEDLTAAARMEPLEEVIDALAAGMKLRHVERLQTGRCDVSGGFTFNDILTDYSRISDHCSNIAAAVLETHGGGMGTHEYLGNVRQKRSAEYERIYKAYKEEYPLP